MRRYTEIVDTPQGPTEVKVIEVEADCGEGPETVQWRQAPGWAFPLPKPRED